MPHCTKNRTIKLLHRLISHYPKGFILKKVIFLGSSYRDICDFPANAKREAGLQIYYVQSGVTPDDWKPMTTVGLGVKEIRVHSNNEYRIIYTAKYKDIVYILHAFIKKSKKTPKSEITIASRNFNKIKRINNEY